MQFSAALFFSLLLHSLEAAETPTFQLGLKVGSQFAPHAGMIFSIQGCNCSSVANDLDVDVVIEVGGSEWQRLGKKTSHDPCHCLPDNADGHDGKRASIVVKDTATGDTIRNTTIATDTNSFFQIYLFYDNQGRPQISGQAQLPTFILNYTTPSDPSGTDKGWVAKPAQVLNGKTADITVPQLPEGLSLALDTLVQVTATWGVAGELFPKIPLDTKQPQAFRLQPYYTAAGPEFAGSGTVLTIAGLFVPATAHVALLLPAGGGQLTTKPGQSNSEGTQVLLEMPDAIDDHGLKPGEYNILLSELRYAAADGKDQPVQMGSSAGPFVFKYKDNRKHPNPPAPASVPPSSPFPYFFGGTGLVLAAATSLFLYRRRRTRYNAITT